MDVIILNIFWRNSGEYILHGFDFHDNSYKACTRLNGESNGHPPHTTTANPPNHIDAKNWEILPIKDS